MKNTYEVTITVKVVLDAPDTTSAAKWARASLHCGPTNEDHGVSKVFTVDSVKMDVETVEKV